MDEAFGYLIVALMVAFPFGCLWLVIDLFWSLRK